MEKKIKSKPWSDALRAFGLILLPITLVYFGMYITTLVMDANQAELDPTWILGLGIEPIKATLPWSITGILCVILITFALPKRRRFWFLLALSIIYALVMLYLFISTATFTPSIYY
jgi:hypothetical protein